MKDEKKTIKQTKTLTRLKTNKKESSCLKPELYKGR